MKLITWSLAAVSFSAALAGNVGFKEDEITLPTYAPGGYDKTPIFYTGRVYQGAQGRVYPYPMQDVLHDEKTDEIYTYLTLENDWLKMGLLPEHGGHLLNFTDKKTGFEIFYRQHVIKPALIGMLGAWISGGVEWNFPHHHRATTAMPIDWKATEQTDGSKTIWIGETELRRRLKWTIGLSMMKDRAVLQAENIFMNRNPYIESMIYWANVSVHCGDDYQVLFPPSCHLGFDHHKNFWTSFPIGPRKESHDLIPSQRSKYADDISGVMDLSWWRNFTVESRSIFALDPDNAWLGGYDHKKNMGTAHVSNRHITVGKKFFLWGNFPEAHVWDTVLTDNDGPYLELMVGCWSDNQPDYSWIAPYETRRVKQYWFPVKCIGGIKNVTIDGAVNVERVGTAKDELLLGFHSTRDLKGCTVELAENGTVVFSEKNVAINPDTPWCKTVKVSPVVKDPAFTGRIKDADGKVFLVYTPVPEDPHDPLPPIVANPKDAKEYASAELAYLTGLRLDQFHNGLIDPVPYYERALAIDPEYSAARVAWGIRLLKGGEFARAETHLRKASDRVTQNYMRAKDAEPEYYLSLALKEQGRFKEAEDLFWRVTWRATLKKEAYAEIARLACLRGDFDEALARIDNALELGARDARLHTIKAYVARKLGKTELAANERAQAVACDPLEYWALLEEGGLDLAEKNRGLKGPQLMEAVCDYYGVGAWDELIAVCDQALAKAGAEKPYRTEGLLPLAETLAACNSYRNPMFAYFKAYALAEKGAAAAAKKAYEAAAAMCGDYCFPSRLEELAVLTRAASSAPAANTYYYLGEILWNLDRKDDALASWKNAVAHKADHALALRCLGFGLSHPGTYFTNTGVSTDFPSFEAYGYYTKAIEADPENFRTLEEADKLAAKLGVAGAERLALMKKYRKTAEKYDACLLRFAYLLNEAEDYDAALDILTTRRFHVWEGSEGLLDPFADALMLRARRRMVAKDLDGAEKDLRFALTYPENLQAGRPGDAGTEPKVRYYLAQCRKAKGDEAGYRAELGNSLKGWIKAGEMDYYRVLALRELGRASETEPLLKELAVVIAELETPAPKVIDAYAKFSGENSPMERQADNVWKAKYLRGLKSELDGSTEEAQKLFAEVAEGKPSILWAKTHLAK